jgi:hypothetical protein
MSAWLSALMLMLSVAVPLVERADLDHQVRWESDHDPAACAPAHDHTICTQVGANLSLPTRSGLPSPVLAVMRVTRPADFIASLRPSGTNANRTRAPPSI